MEYIKKLKLAVIMDEFTYSCYSPECEIMQLTPHDFRNEIDRFSPDIVFIESVWRGKDNLWRFKLHDDMTDITALVTYCKELHIPTVFWSKEDPVHFGVFIRVAALVDYVFTTDADCIELYKAYLGHDRVYFLPFAAQPAIHNPLEEYERVDKFCFAGSFYVKYKERSQAFMDLSPLFLQHGLDIYDRNYDKTKSDNNSQSLSVASPVVENYFYPPELQKCVLGVLPYSEISKAYKGYKYGINMTSMVQSGYMFARRAFELLACNTVTVSNYSRGLPLFFGDLLISTNDIYEMRDLLNKYCSTEESYRKFRLAGLRHVLKEHLYEDRLNRISEKVLGRSIVTPLPKILVICSDNNENIKRMFDSQTYTNKQLVMGENSNSLEQYDFDYITIFSSNDYYGKNYLTDLALATRFSRSDAIGKVEFYSDKGLQNKNKAYCYVDEKIDLTKQMISKSCLPDDMNICDLFTYKPLMRILSLDEFNYCQNASFSLEADDIEISDSGEELQKIYDYTDNIPPVKLHKEKVLSLEEIYKNLEIRSEDLSEKSYSDGRLKISRNSDDDSIVWLRTKNNYKLSEYSSGSRIGFFTEVYEKSGNVRCQVEYYDKDNKKLGFLNFALDGFSLLRINNDTYSFKLIFRLRGKASVTVKSIYSSSPDSLIPAPFILKKSILITDEYPSCEYPDIAHDLHEFALKHDLEVLKVGYMPCYLPYYEYEGIQVIASQYDCIGEVLCSKQFDEIYIHQKSNEIEKRIADYKDKVKVI